MEVALENATNSFLDVPKVLVRSCDCWSSDMVCMKELSKMLLDNCHLIYRIN